MLADSAQAFREVGLDINFLKSHWTSYPTFEGMQINIGAESISWEPNLTFAGAKLDLPGIDEAACNHRAAQAQKV